MNRLSPPAPRLFGRRVSLVPISDPIEPEASQILDDLRLFATGWIGGLVFFGTFLA